MSTILINQDKTLSINGVKTFPIFTYDATRTYTVAKNDGIPEISQRYDFTMKGWGSYWCGTYDWRKYQSQYESTNLLYTAEAMHCSPCPSDINICVPINQQITHPFTTIDKDASNFFGYNHIDEPLTQRYADYTTLLNTYNTIKMFDQNHPVMVTHNPYSNTSTNDYVFKSQDYADIILEDHYTKRNTYPNTFDYLYYFERISAVYTFANTKTVDNYNKPFWVVIQANGKDAVDSNGSIILKTTPQEVRLETYLAITIGYNGIGHWAYNTQSKNVTTGIWENNGTWTDPILWQGVKDLYNEIKILNDILILPDVGRSWFKHENDSTVLINHINMTKPVSWYGEMRKINYVLKRNPITNIYYLIVVNKDNLPISNVSIKINGVTNAFAETIGLLGTGSSTPGRILTINNGTFIDNFDGYAVHIYQISNCTTPQCNFTINVI